jgi:hypothetical protein
MMWIWRRNVSSGDVVEGLFVGWTYDLEGVGNDADGHELFAVVAAVHHEGVGKALDDRALGFSESLFGISTGGVGNVDWGADLDIVAV